MKAVYYEEHGGPEVLRYGNFPDPAVPPGWVKLRVLATSLNWLDVATRRGLPGIAVELPGITGGDVAGEIAELGEGVTGWKLGDRVLPMPGHFDKVARRIEMLGETRRGALAEYCTVRAEQLMALPDGVSAVDAACLPVAYGTAMRMVGQRGRIAAGEKVLILGASGGVGTASVLLCKMLGAHVIAAAGSQQKCDALRALGADETIDYSVENVADYARRTTGTLFRGGGYDVVINFTGGETWEPSLRCVKKQGRVLTCGATAGFMAITDLRFVWSSEMQILGSNGWQREDQQALIDLVASGRLKPVVDRVLPLSRGREACSLLEQRQVLGKIVVQPDALLGAA